MSRLGVASLAVTHNKSENSKKILDVVDEAIGQGIDFLVLPECALQSYIYGVQHKIEADEWLYHDSNAEEIPGPFTEQLADACQRGSIYVQCGLTEITREMSGAVMFDSVVLVGPEGLLGTYRKTHLGGDENHVFSPGRNWRAFDLPFGRIGPLICYDLIFPEAARELALRGCQIVSLSTAWPTDNLEGYPQESLHSQLDLFVLARATENQMFVACSTLTGLDDRSTRAFYGHSQIVGPDGRHLASLKDREGLIHVDIEPIREVRRARYLGHNGLNFIKDRRPTLYQTISDEELYDASVVN
jgi:predicted amidohydrolase